MNVEGGGKKRGLRMKGRERGEEQGEKTEMEGGKWKNRAWGGGRNVGKENGDWRRKMEGR